MNLNELKDTADMETESHNDVGNQHQTITREKSIKSKVAQDTANWMLKEQHHETMTQNETLQQNLVQLQVEYGSVSAQLQDELRLRPEILVKLSGEICDGLQDEVARVQTSMQRSAAEYAPLEDAYTRAGDNVASVRVNNENKSLAATNELRSLQGQVDLSAQYRAHMMAVMSWDHRIKQAAAVAERLREQKAAMAVKLAYIDTLIKERQKTIQELRNDLQRVTTKFNMRESVIVGLQREAGAASELRAALAREKARAEAAARDATQHATRIALVKAANEEATQRGETLTKERQELQSRLEKMKEAMQFLVTTNEDLAELIKDKNEKICSLEKNVTNTKKEAHAFAENLFATITVNQRERELRDSEERIASAQRELIERTATIEKLMVEIAQLNEAKTRTEATVTDQAAQLERQRNDNQIYKISTDYKMAKCADTITRLEHDIKREAEARARADHAVAKLTAERERENCDYKKRAAVATRDLAACNEMITQLNNDLPVKREARACADAALVQQAGEHVANAERELTESNEAIVNLQRELAMESNAHALAVASLDSVSAKLNNARSVAVQFPEDVRHLGADARSKDEEAASTDANHSQH